MGIWIYLLLFTVVFCETGLVFAPFLPGDSLLFAAGTFAAAGSLNIILLFIIFAIAAIGGDSLNYWIGSFIGPRAFNDKIPLLKKEYLTRTNLFYAKHGGRTVILARFIPMMRSFAPFENANAATTMPCSSIPEPSTFPGTTTVSFAFVFLLSLERLTTLLFLVGSSRSSATRDQIPAF